MRYKKDIYLSILGNINCINSWSGTGFYSLKSLQKIYTNIYGLNLETNSLNYKFHKFFWLFYSFFFQKNLGGFQYSEHCLRILWKKKYQNLQNNKLISFFPILPESIVNDPKIEKYFYIDITLNQLFHDYGKPKFMSKKYYKSIKKREIKNYRKSCHIFTHSEYARQDIIKNYYIKPSKVTCVLPGANLPIISNASSAKNKKDFLKLVFIGKELHRKGLDRILKAMEICNKNKKICELSIIGGLIENELNLKSLKNVSNVKEYGFIDKETHIKKFIKIINSSDLGLLLSRAEAGGMSLREFAYLGLPSIAVNVGGILEHLNSSSSILLSSYEDEEIIEELSNILIDLYENKNKLRIMHKNAKKNARLFSWKYSWGKILSILDKT